MENAIVAIISTMLIIISSLMMTMSTLQSTSQMAAAWQSMNTTFNNMRSTSISAEGYGDYNGDDIWIKVTNDGQCNLYDFDRWDVIAQYDDGTSVYLTYLESGTIEANQWTIAGIYTVMDYPDIFDPGILNPEEYMLMQVDMTPEINVNESARITISTSSGITDQCIITRLP